MTQKGMSPKAIGLTRKSENIFCVCKIILFILFFSVLFLSFPISAEEIVITKTTGAAVASFGATSAAVSAVCLSDTFSDSILVRNQGTVPDTYSFAIDAEEEVVASWLTVSETSVELQPGEEKEVLVWSKPGKEGTFSYRVEIASQYSSVKEIEKTITVTSCPNIALQTYTIGQETCPCSTGVSVFELENAGGFTETYVLEMTGINPDYYDLSEDTVTLAPGEEKDIYAYVRMACFVWGSFDFTLHAETQTSGYTAEIPLSLEIPQACYNYDIALGEAVLFDKNETIDISFTEAEDTEYEFCQETPAVIPVQIKNPTDVKNSYVLAIEDAEEWIVPAAAIIQISKEEEELTSLVVNPAAAEPGNYSFALKADSLRGDVEAVLPFTVMIEQCEEKEMPTWLKYLLAGILALILLAILFALIILWQKKGAPGKNVSALQLQKVQKAAERFWQKHKKLFSILLPLLLVFFIIGALAYPLVKERYAASLAAGATSSAAEQETVEPLFYNWLTALIILGLFLLLFFLLWYFKFRKKPKKKRKGSLWNWEKIKPVLKWLWIILLLLVLLAALGTGMYFLYKNYKEDAQKYLIEQNATVDETEEQAQPTTEEAAALQEQLAAIEKQLAEKEKEIAALDEQLMNFTEQLAREEALSREEEVAFEERIAALQEQIASFEKQGKELEEKKKELLEKLGLLDEKVTILEENVSDLEQQIAALQEKIAALEDIIEQLRKEQEERGTEETEEVIEKVQEEIEDLKEQSIVLEEVLEITDDSFETMLLFDVSLSAQIVEGGSSRFEKGIALAKKYIQEKGRYSLMVVGKNAIVIRRKVDSETVLRTITYLRPLDTQSNLGKALLAAAKKLSSSGRIVLISDMKTTDGRDIWEMKEEIEQQGIDVIFVNVAQQKIAATEEETKEEAEEEETTAEDETEGPVFDVETQTAGKFFIEILKNTKYSIDLSKYFVDEDNDSLQYTAEPGEHLSALLEEREVTLIPEKDWTGETTVVFGADDEKGGKVQSPAIKVVVKEEEGGEEGASEAESSEEEQASTLSQYVPWIILGSIIFLILVSLVMGAFARKFHKEPEIPENKEESEEKKEE